MHTPTLRERRIELELLALALQIAKIPKTTYKTVSGVLTRVFEGLERGEESMEMISMTEARALGLTLRSAVQETDKEFEELSHRSDKLTAEITNLEKECKRYEEELTRRYHHFQKHEAAALTEDARSKAAALRDTLRTP